LIKLAVRRSLALLVMVGVILFSYTYISGARDNQQVVKNSGCSLTKSIDEFVASARDYQEKTLYFLAVESYSCAIQIDPQRMSLYSLRAYNLIIVGQFERAVGDINRVLTAEPHNTVPHVLLTMMYFQQERYEDALREIDTTLELNHLESYSYLIRGQIYVKINNEGKAMEAFQQYFQLQKLSLFEAQAYAEMGFAYEHFGVMTAAQSYLRQAVALHGDVGTLYLSIAQQYRSGSNYEMALENFNKAIRLNTPELVSAYYERAAVYMGLQDDAHALGDCESIIRLEPQKATGYVCKGAVFLDLHQSKPAMDNFNQAIELDKNAISAYSGRAVAEIYTQHYDLALTDLNYAIQSEPLISNPYRIRATVYSLLNNPSAAIADYESYLRLAGGAAAAPEIVDNIQHLKAKMGNV
jgi:tetratricopeptide (TPR) repeat protein